MVRLVIQARLLWDELQDDAGEILLEEIGGADHGNWPPRRASLDAMAVAGVPFGTVAARCRGRALAPPGFEGTVVHQPTAGRCLADATVAALLRRAEEHGQTCGAGGAGHGQPRR